MCISVWVREGVTAHYTLGLHVMSASHVHWGRDSVWVDSRMATMGSVYFPFLLPSDPQHETHLACPM